MSKVTVFVGLDYHKDSVQVCARDRDGQVLTNRTRPSAIAVFVAYVRSAIDVPPDRGETRDEWSQWTDGLLRPSSSNLLRSENTDARHRQCARGTERGNVATWMAEQLGLESPLRSRGRPTNRPLRQLTITDLGHEESPCL